MDCTLFDWESGRERAKADADARARQLLATLQRTLRTAYPVDADDDAFGELVRALDHTGGGG